MEACLSNTDITISGVTPNGRETTVTAGFLRFTLSSITTHEVYISQVERSMSGTAGPTERYRFWFRYEFGESRRLFAGGGYLLLNKRPRRQQPDGWALLSGGTA